MKALSRQNFLQFAITALVSFVLGLLSLYLHLYLSNELNRVLRVIFNGYVFIIAFVLLVLSLTSIMPESKRKMLAHAALAYVFLYFGMVIHGIYLIDWSVLDNF